MEENKNTRYEEMTSAKNLSTSVGPKDVLCGRRKAAFNNVGNRRFRVIVSLYAEKYMRIENTRKDKNRIIQNIIDAIHECGGRFLQIQNDTLCELSTKQIFEKVGHALRDYASSKNYQDQTWMTQPAEAE